MQQQAPDHTNLPAQPTACGGMTPQSGTPRACFRRAWRARSSPRWTARATRASRRSCRPRCARCCARARARRPAAGSPPARAWRSPRPTAPPPARGLAARAAPAAPRRCARRPCTQHDLEGWDQEAQGALGGPAHGRGVPGAQPHACSACAFIAACTDGAHAPGQPQACRPCRPGRAGG